MQVGKISSKFLVSAIVILVVITGILGYLNYQEDKLPEGQIRVKAGNKVIGAITLDEIKKLPAVNKKLVIDSTTGLSKHKFTCTPLLEVFNHIDPQIIKQYKRVLTRGVDNYVSGVDMAEVLEKNNVLLVYADNGEPLKSKTGPQDTMRIVILNDPFGQRFTNYLVEIELE
ncbi:MAG: molybdopterin-dependent oxidoreductase [Syntrophomonadaceae bacterium]|nr:molybdopterin-dependent oxidoreductase [Syntrophomonadaceae bacterium]